MRGAPLLGTRRLLPRALRATLVEAMHSLFVTDLDGTLLTSARAISARVRAALVALPARGVVRAVATGRSLYSALEVLPADTPIDYLVYSSGAGVMRFRDRISLATWVLDEEPARTAMELFVERGVDFMVHAPPPHSHRFAYYTVRSPPDFAARVTRYDAHCRALSRTAVGQLDWHGPASQLVAMPSDPRPAAQVHADIAAALPTLRVVRTTSPLDHRSLWLEVFASNVSKAHACAWLATKLGIAHAETYAVGNDYNDEALLLWARHACMVENADPSLRARFGAVASHEADGVAEALERFGLLCGAGERGGTRG